MIQGDSIEYDLLKKWCETLPFFEEPKSVTSCEIGVREGLGSQVIMLGLKARIQDKPYEHIAIDPYNNIKYQHYDDTPEYTCDYTEDMKSQMIKDFSNNKNFNFYHMTDIMFMNLFNNGKKIFDLVHFDGPHMTRDVVREAVWFADRSRKGTRFIFDDYKKYGMDSIAKTLSYWDFKTFESGENKICLQRV